MAIKRLEEAIDQFAEAMKAKLRKKANAGWGGWDYMTQAQIIQRATGHLSRARSDPEQDVDVANFMLFHFANRKHL